MRCEEQLSLLQSIFIKPSYVALHACVFMTEFSRKRDVNKLWPVSVCLCGFHVSHGKILRHMWKEDEETVLFYLNGSSSEACRRPMLYYRDHLVP